MSREKIRAGNVPPGGVPRKAILITGTDTGAGKTYVSCLLGKAMREKGFAVRPLKPVESGCKPGADGAPFPGDASSLREAFAPDLPLSAVCLYPLAAPLSPHLAAGAEGVAIDVDRIRSAIAGAAEASDIVLVEGAGGITVEICEGYSFADLAKDARLPVLVVAQNRLGALNHVCLTLHFLRSGAVPVAGVVLNDTTPEPFPARDGNEGEVRRIAGDRYLGRVPHGARSLPEGILAGLFGFFPRR
ncbi:MAG: dethiobiotin synthase [Candidatus Deferrimicrobiaceae bacterium]